MKDKGKFVGTDIITSNSVGHWTDDMNTFIQYFGNEVRKCTDVQQITGKKFDDLLKQNGWEDDGTKFYFSSAVYSYTREDWEAMYDNMTNENKQDIYDICDELANQ